jgi:uroporphyrinogen-III synthase
MVNDNNNNSSIVIITRELKGSDLIYEQILKSMGLTLLQHKVIDVLKDELQVNRVVELIINNRYDYILFMSSSAVRFITQGLRLRGLEPSIINKASVIAIGPSTRSELLSNGIRVDLMPDRYSSYGVLEMFKAMDCYGKSILIPRSMEASDILAEGLKALGLDVYEEHIYKIVPSIHEGWGKIAEIICSNKVFIIFTSSSIVDTFIRVLRGYMNKRKDVISIMKDHAICIAIGPLTYEALLKHGLSASVADEHTVSGTFKLLLKLIKDNMSNVR